MAHTWGATQSIPSDMVRQISLRFCAIWSIFIVHMNKLHILGYKKWAKWKFWSDCKCPGWSEPSLDACVCAEVLRPSLPNAVMSSMVSLPNHTFTGQAKRLTNIVHIIVPFLIQQKGENDRRKYFMINLYERMLPTLAVVEHATSLPPVGRRIQMSHRCHVGRYVFWCYDP